MDTLIKDALLDPEFTLETYQSRMKTFKHRLEICNTLLEEKEVEEKWALYMSIYKQRRDNAQVTATETSQKSLDNCDSSSTNALGSAALVATCNDVEYTI